MSETAQLIIELNGALQAFPSGITLAAVVARQARDPASIATAVNGAFVARQMRHAHQLGEGDVVLFFSPMVGG
jgi:sulfur carrier protein